MTHTPGPWKVGVSGLNNDGSRPVSSEAGRIAFVHVRDEDAPSKNLWQFDDPERDANARLIAAAPTLLAALKEARTQAPIGSALRKVIDEALDAALEPTPTP